MELFLTPLPPKLTITASGLSLYMCYRDQHLFSFSNITDKKHRTV